MPQGKVKWFNNAKGYGFIIEDGQSEDLFAHFSSIQMDGYKTLKAGQAVHFEKQPSGKGTHAVNISAVETSIPDQQTLKELDDEIISVEEQVVGQGSSDPVKEEISVDASGKIATV